MRLDRLINSPADITVCIMQHRRQLRSHPSIGSHPQGVIDLHELVTRRSTEGTRFIEFRQFDVERESFIELAQLL